MKSSCLIVTFGLLADINDYFVLSDRFYPSDTLSLVKLQNNSQQNEFIL